MEILQKYLNQSDNVDPESKKEHELNTSDRMILINKKTDEKFLVETYENLIRTKKFMNIENIKNVDINDYVFDDVEFSHDHYLNNDKGLFYKLDKSSTKIGSLLLKNIFLKPIYDIDVLKNRQDIIKKIYNAKNDIIPILNEIKLLESDLIWFWNNSNLNHIDLMNDLIYFNYDIIPFFNMNEVLNNNEKALLITNIYKIIVSPILTILTPLMSLLIPLVVLFYMRSKVKLDISLWDITKQYFKTLLGSDSMKMIFTNPTKAMMASFATKGIYLFMYLQNIYYTFQSAASTHKIINIIHEKLNKMTQYVKLSDKLKTVCASHHIDDISSFINYSNIKEDIHIYENYFNFPVFNNEPKLFSNKGKILSTFKKFKENKDNMISIFHYTGIIDALTSIGNVVMSSTAEHPYCYTTFLNKKVPTVNIKNIWHPYLDKDVMSMTVKNNIDIKNNILITGPNAAGKSTFIKSVILNIILSQTVGISSAESFEITPFKLIETYLHIPDSKGSSSLFEAEMFRSKDYIEKIKFLHIYIFTYDKVDLSEIF